MLLGEPPQSQADLHFSLFGIPVRVHPMFWLIGVLLVARSLFDAGDPRQAFGILLPWIVAFFVSILVHEFGHATAMRSYGFSPWITLYGLGGLASYSPAQGYGSKGTGPLGHVLISLAGPGAGFVLAALIVAGVMLAGEPLPLDFGGDFGLEFYKIEVGSALFGRLLGNIISICIFWGFLNLLPVYPLDGGQIARELFLAISPRDGIRNSLYLSILTGAALAVVGLVVWQSLLTGFLFGYLAYTSYATLQSYTGPGRW